MLNYGHFSDFLLDLTGETLTHMPSIMASSNFGNEKLQILPTFDWLFVVI